MASAWACPGNVLSTGDSFRVEVWPRDARSGNGVTNTSQAAEEQGSGK